MCNTILENIKWWEVENAVELLSMEDVCTVECRMKTWNIDGIFSSEEGRMGMWIWHLRNLETEEYRVVEQIYGRVGICQLIEGSEFTNLLKVANSPID